MIIPHLHFNGNCEEAINVYENAFKVKVENIVRNSDYELDKYEGDKKIAHAVMNIHGQTIYLNDRFGNKDKTLDVAIHLIVWFKSVDELLACYEYLKEESIIIDPFKELPYSKLAGNFMDKFGVLWGFMAEK